MRSPLVVTATICLLLVVPACSVASASAKVTYQATFDLPSEIQTHKVQVLPITVRVAAPDGQAFSGKVDLWAGAGAFLKEDGAPSSDYPFPVEVKAGVGHARLSFEGKEDWRSPLVLTATLGPYLESVVLGRAEAKIRYQESIEVSASVPAVPADGLASPVVAVVIKDQFGDPLEDVKVIARFKHSGRKTDVVARTGKDGVARVSLLPSAHPGYALGQVLTSRLASVMLPVLYREPDPEMIPLREVAERSGAKVAWDAATRTAVIATGGLRLHITEGKEVAVRDGQAIPLGAAARMRDGHLEVPAAFASLVF